MSMPPLVPTCPAGVCLGKRGRFLGVFTRKGLILTEGLPMGAFVPGVFFGCLSGGSVLGEFVCGRSGKR